jgi:hypothetical protein
MPVFYFNDLRYHESENACLCYNLLIGTKLRETSALANFHSLRMCKRQARLPQERLILLTTQLMNLPSYFISHFRPRIPGMGSVNIPISIDLW